MILYILLYIFIFCAAFVFDFVGKGRSRHYLSVYKMLYCFLAFLVAFRYGVGSDTPEYMLMFDLTPDLAHLSYDDFESFRSQPLFVVFCSLCKTISSNFLILQLLQAILFYHSFYLLTKTLKLRKFYLLIVFYGYVYFQEQSAMRECFGLSFCFYALYGYIKNRKLWRYYLFVIFGFLCHSSMVFFCFVPLVRVMNKLNLKNTIIVVVVVALFVILLYKAQDFLLLIGDSSISRYGAEEGASLKLSTFIFSSVLFVAWYYCCVKNKTDDHPEFIYLGLLYVLFELVGALFLPIMYRFTAHLCIFYFYCLHIIIHRLSTRSVLSYICLMFVFYTPMVRFSTGIKVDPSLEYCSVFSFDKSYQEKRIKDADGSDMFKL